MSKIKWISDIINDEYKNWEKQAILIDSPTGSGKTSFVFDVLYPYALSKGKGILYLCNRSALKEQVNKNGSSKTKEIVEEIIKYDQSSMGDQEFFCKVREHLTVATYQALQKSIINRMHLEDYDYIICDECHYFFTDASFNPETDIAWSFLWKKRKSCVVIYMSATAQPLFNLIEEKENEFKRQVKRYKLNKNYDAISNIVFYSNTDDLMAHIDLIAATDEKAAIFTNEIKIFDKFYNSQYKDIVDFYCSEYTTNTKLRDICSKRNEIKNYIIGNGTFRNRILISTSALDNGIDLKDKKLKHIFCDFENVYTMMQALGRKRSLNEKDTYNLYIKEASKYSIEKRKRNIEGELEPARILKGQDGKYRNTKGLCEYAIKHNILRTFYSQRTVLYSDLQDKEYPGYPKVNKLARFGYECELKFFEQAIVDGYDVTFYKYYAPQLLSSYLKEKEKQAEKTKEDQMDKMIELCKFYKDKKIFVKKELELKEDLIRRINDMCIEGKTISKINEGFKCLGYRAEIISKKAKYKDEKNKSTYWMLVTEA